MELPFLKSKKSIGGGTPPIELLVSADGKKKIETIKEPVKSVPGILRNPFGTSKESKTKAVVEKPKIASQHLSMRDRITAAILKAGK